MKKFLIILLIAIIAVSAQPPKRDPPLLCYLATWALGGRFPYEDLDANLCTHIVLAFATLKDYKLAEAEWNDADKYKKIIALKQINPNLKVLIAIGGANMGVGPFKELSSNVDRIRQFASHATKFLRQHQFDGLDIDWEEPSGPADKKAFSSLLKELRLAFENEAKSSGQPRLLLTAAVPVGIPKIEAGYDVPEISKYLDYINVMAYDFHGTWEQQVGHNSPLFDAQNSPLTVDYASHEWARRGAPKEKLLIGMPTYGRTFTLRNPSQVKMGSPSAGGGQTGPVSGEAGILFYSEICDMLKKNKATLDWDDKQKATFAHWGNQWVGFDDERSLKVKVNWLKEKGFGGIMVWTLDEDDSRGSCGAGKYPLITAMKTELGNYKVDPKYAEVTYEPSTPTGQEPSEDTEIENENADDAEVICNEAADQSSYHPDKANCNMYFVCEGKRKHHMPCPSNLVFNPSVNTCDWPANVEGCN